MWHWKLGPHPTNFAATAPLRKPCLKSPHLLAVSSSQWPLNQLARLYCSHRVHCTRGSAFACWGFCMLMGAPINRHPTRPSAWQHNATSPHQQALFGVRLKQYLPSKPGMGVSYFRKARVLWQLFHHSGGKGRDRIKLKMKCTVYNNSNPKCIVDINTINLVLLPRLLSGYYLVVCDQKMN